MPTEFIKIRLHVGFASWMRLGCLIICDHRIGLVTGGETKLARKIIGHKMRCSVLGRDAE
ncbi:hypothetical protein Enr13x_23680 [Stieleria neptunia]|uniref:Uncharacterized protein n=1 Tax=Stieleria neptunia TaxID=2527979 RepID=A0A518HNU4_9BACT|nr:hypothetical protein [Stieleria neptunia]QDV42520.1 hypothetical protein Enr13x_23680 [Stieleria neptunia]